MSPERQKFDSILAEDELTTANRPVSLKDRAYLAIRGAILRHELKPNTQLSEAGLAERIGISRTPVREALKRLEEEGLVQVVPRQGAFVTDITVEDIAEIYQLREAIECFSIQYIPDYGDPAELDLLMADAKKSIDWIKTGEIDKINECDIHLHRYIARASQNQLIIKLIDQLLNQIIRLRLMTPTVPGRLQRQAEEHIQIVSALKDGDVERARKALQNHLLNVRNTFLQMRLGLGIADEGTFGGDYNR